MSRRRSKSLDVFGEISYRLSMLAGVGGLLLGVQLASEAPDEQSIIIIVGTAVAAMFSTLFLMLILRRLFVGSRPKQIDSTFTFNEMTPTIGQRNRHASEFEYEVASLINETTGKRTTVVGGAGDGGVDIKVHDQQGRLVGIVQCKKFAPHKVVSPGYLRELNTVKHQHQVNTAYLVTTGRFSNDSQKLAQQLGIRLIDGQALAEMRTKVLRRRQMPAS